MIKPNCLPCTGKPHYSNVVLSPLLVQFRAVHLKLSIEPACKHTICLSLWSRIPLGGCLGAVSPFGQMCSPSCGPGCAAEDYSQYSYLASALTKLSKLLISFNTSSALGKCSSSSFAEEEWCRLTFGQGYLEGSVRAGN